jgi:hypothetical protein
MGVFGQPLHHGGSGFGPGETRFSWQCGSERMLSAGSAQPGRAVAIVVSLTLKSTPLGVQQVKTVVLSNARAERPVYIARWEAHMAVDPTGGQWVAQQ